jgi:putative Flp pilus-assembly TadE/G-like protein
MASTRSERGQAVPLLLVVLALAVAAALLVGAIGAAASRRARAQTAADAAALAGAVAGEPAARALAADNDGSLESFERAGGVATAVVRVDDASATASAEASSSAALAPAGGGDRRALAPAMHAALARADELLGRPVEVVRGDGLWIEVAPTFVSSLVVMGRDAGLCRLQPLSHPLHFATCPPTSPP